MMLDHTGRGLSVLEILAKMKKLDGQQLAVCQRQEPQGQAGGADGGGGLGMGEGGRTVGTVGVALALQRGWVSAADVAEANLLRENTKRQLIQLFYKMKEEERHGLVGGRVGGEKGRLVWEGKVDFGKRFSLFGEGLRGLDVPVDVEKEFEQCGGVLGEERGWGTFAGSKVRA